MTKPAVQTRAAQALLSGYAPRSGVADELFDETGASIDSLPEVRAEISSAVKTLLGSEYKKGAVVMSLMLIITVTCGEILHI